MICSNCRSTIFNDSRFCSFCGSEINRNDLRLEKLREIGTGGMVLAAAIFTAFQGLFGIFNAAWFMSLLELSLAVSLFIIWRGCQKDRSPITGLKLAMYTTLITIVGSLISYLVSTEMLIPAVQGVGSESYLFITRAMAIIIVVFATGLGLTMWILYFLFYRSLYLAAIQKTQKVRYTGFVSVMYLITAGAAVSSFLMFLPTDLKSIFNGGWSDPYVNTFKPIWMYLSIQMKQWIHFILQFLFYICSGISSLLIGLTVINIKKVWR